MNKYKKYVFVAGAIVLGLLLLVAENLWIVSICEQIVSEENWLQIPVSISDGKEQKDIGKFTMSDRTGDFIYEDKEGTSFYNDWFQIANDVTKAKAVKSPTKQIKPKTKVLPKK